MWLWEGINVMSGLCKGAEVRFCETVQGFNDSEAEAGLLAFVFLLLCALCLGTTVVLNSARTEILADQIFCRHSNIKVFNIIRFGHPLITKTLNIVFHLNVQVDFSYFLFGESTVDGWNTLQRLKAWVACRMSSLLILTHRLSVSLIAVTLGEMTELF